MKILHIMGADLSKDSIDLGLYPGKSYLRIDNSINGFHLMLNWLKDQGINASTVMIVMEHTGLYSYHMEAFLHKHQIRFTKVPALQIKRSLGMIRGKTDKIDAQRIARYGYEKKDSLVALGKPDQTLKRLQILHSTRRRLVRYRASLKCAVKENRVVLKESDIVIQTDLVLIKNFTKQIKTIESEIQKLVTTSKSIRHNCELLESVIGAGPVVAVTSIVKTGNFTEFANGRKFACYSGIAPFEHSSGTSIRKKTRVSHLADKEMKALLDRAASSAIQYDKELKAYYERRLQMGKSPRSTLNIVRNKIVHRMFAVIKRGTPFVENYLRAV